MCTFYMTCGTGTGRTNLTSLDNALLHSGIANYNLVKISSILPAGSKESDYILHKEGSVLHTAYAALTSNRLGKTISAAVGVAIPNDDKKIGVIMEYSNYCSKKEAEEQIKAMLLEAMENRGCSIKEIKTVASEATVSDNKFTTVFAALSIE